jgi:hypothetical protein
VLRNLALHHAPAFARAGALHALVRVLEQAALRDSNALAVAEPLCGALKRLAQDSACAVMLIGLGAKRLLETALPVLATEMASSDGGGHAALFAKQALRQLLDVTCHAGIPSSHVQTRPMETSLAMNPQV